MLCQAGICPAYYVGQAADMAMCPSLLGHILTAKLSFIIWGFLDVTLLLSANCGRLTGHCHGQVAMPVDSFNRDKNKCPSSKFRDYIYLFCKTAKDLQ